MLERAPLEKLARLARTRVAEVMHQEIRHLVAVAHLFAVDARQRLKVVLGRRRVVEMPLLLDRGELGVALHRDQILAGVADALVGNFENGLPLPLALEVAELDLRVRVAEERGELVVADVIADHADLALPGIEVVAPILPRLDRRHVTSP